MGKVTIQVVEDDGNYALELEMILQGLGFDTLPPLSSPAEIINEVGTAADLVISDIYFNGEPKGVELVRQLHAQNIPVILLTANPNDSVYRDARSLMAAGFAVKPVAPFSLRSLIEVALTAENHPVLLNNAMRDWSRQQLIGEYIFMRHAGVLVKVVVSDIFKIEADGNYCYVSVGNYRYVIKNSLSNIKKELIHRGFLQVNRKQLVNFRFINKVDFKNSIVLLENEELIIGAAFRKEVETWLNRL
jgi:DNA-binding LytR/AlgR family response regulator